MSNSLPPPPTKDEQAVPLSKFAKRREAKDNEESDDEEPDLYAKLDITITVPYINNRFSLSGWPTVSKFKRGAPIYGFPALEIDGKLMRVKCNEDDIHYVTYKPGGANQIAFIDLEDNECYLADDGDMIVPNAFIPIGRFDKGIHTMRGPVRKKGQEFNFEAIPEKELWMYGTIRGCIYQLMRSGYDQKAIAEMIVPDFSHEVALYVRDKYPILAGILAPMSTPKQIEQAERLFVVTRHAQERGYELGPEFKEVVKTIWQGCEDKEPPTQAEIIAGNFARQVQESERSNPLRKRALALMKNSMKVSIPTGPWEDIDCEKFGWRIFLEPGCSYMFSGVNNVLQAALNALNRFKRTLLIIPCVRQEIDLVSIAENPRSGRRVAKLLNSGKRAESILGYTVETVNSSTGRYVFHFSAVEGVPQAYIDRINCTVRTLSFDRAQADTWNRAIVSVGWPEYNEDSFIEPGGVQLPVFFPTFRNLSYELTANSETGDEATFEQESFANKTLRIKLGPIESPETIVETIIRAWYLREEVLRNLDDRALLAWMNERVPALVKKYSLQATSKSVSPPARTLPEKSPRVSAQQEESKSSMNLSAGPLIWRYRIAASSIFFPPGEFYPSRLIPNKLPYKNIKRLSFNTAFLCRMEELFGGHLWCIYCGKRCPTLPPDDHSKGPRMSADHIMPSSIAPEFEFHAGNLIPCCTSCNSKRGNAVFSLADIHESYSDPYLRPAIKDMTVQTQARAEEPSVKKPSKKKVSIAPSSSKINVEGLPKKERPKEEKRALPVRKDLEKDKSPSPRREKSRERSSHKETKSEVRPEKSSYVKGFYHSDSEGEPEKPLDNTQKVFHAIMNRENPQAIQAICAQTRLSKREVNQILYSLEKLNLVSRTVENPPLWSVITNRAEKFVPKPDLQPQPAPKAESQPLPTVQRRKNSWVELERDGKTYYAHNGKSQWEMPEVFDESVSKPYIALESVHAQWVELRPELENLGPGVHYFSSSRQVYKGVKPEPAGPAIIRLISHIESNHRVNHCTLRIARGANRIPTGESGESVLYYCLGTMRLIEFDKSPSFTPDIETLYRLSTCPGDNRTISALTGSFYEFVFRYVEKGENQLPAPKPIASSAKTGQVKALIVTPHGESSKQGKSNVLPGVETEHKNYKVLTVTAARGNYHPTYPEDAVAMVCRTGKIMIKAAGATSFKRMPRNKPFVLPVSLTITSGTSTFEIYSDVVCSATVKSSEKNSRWKLSNDTVDKLKEAALGKIEHAYDDDGTTCYGFFRIHKLASSLVFLRGKYDIHYSVGQLFDTVASWRTLGRPPTEVLSAAVDDLRLTAALLLRGADPSKSVVLDEDGKPYYTGTRAWFLLGAFVQSGVVSFTPGEDSDDE